jgi:hypothetical protein
MGINWTVDESGIGTIEIDHQDRLNALTIDDWRTMRAQLACRVASRRAAEPLLGACSVGARRAVRLRLADATASELGGGERTAGLADQRRSATKTSKRQVLELEGAYEELHAQLDRQLEGLTDAVGGAEFKTFSLLSRLVGSGRRLTRATGPRLHQISARPRSRLYALCRRRGRRGTPSKASSAMHNLFVVAKNEHD